jgi:hypothetical protein
MKQSDGKWWWLTPQLLQRMDADPMWKLMRNGEFAQMMSDQQEQIDRVLGRGAPTLAYCQAAEWDRSPGCWAVWL